MMDLNALEIKVSEKSVPILISALMGRILHDISSPVTSTSQALELVHEGICSHEETDDIAFQSSRATNAIVSFMQKTCSFSRKGIASDTDRIKNIIENYINAKRMRLDLSIEVSHKEIDACLLQSLFVSVALIISMVAPCKSLSVQIKNNKVHIFGLSERKISDSFKNLDVSQFDYSTPMHDIMICMLYCISKSAHLDASYEIDKYQVLLEIK